jgi:hypothetical protein
MRLASGKTAVSILSSSAAVEDALSFMSKGEVAAYVVPASQMRPEAGPGRRAGGGADGGGSSSSSSGEDDESLLGAAGRRSRGQSLSGTTGGGRAGAAGSKGASTTPCLVPPPPDRCTQVELEVELLSMVQASA